MILRNGLFITSDAPGLPVSPIVAGRILHAQFAHVQSSYLDKVGYTFDLGEPFVWRGKRTQASYMGKGAEAQFSIYKELDEEGVIDVGDGSLMIYVQVWGPQDNMNGTGMCDSRWWYPNRTPYGPRFMDPPSCIRDLLDMKTWGGMWNKYGKWWLQACGRLWHEIAHIATGEVWDWWNYPDIQPTAIQVAALAKHPCLWIHH